MLAILEIVIVVAVYLVIALFGMRALAGLGFVTAKGGANTATSAPLFAAAVINIVIAALAILVNLAFGGSLNDLRPSVGVPDIGWALLGGGLMLGVATSFARLNRARRVGPTAGTWLTALLILALFCAALMEEIVFRAVIIGALQPYGFWTALLVSALIFTLIHLPTNRITAEAVAGWFIGGIAFGGAWLLGAPLIVVTLIHLGHNLGNVLWVQPAAQFGRVEMPKASPGMRLARYGVDAVVILALVAIAYKGL